MADTDPPFDAPAGWELQQGRLHRELRFDDFAQAFAFMTRVAAEAERLDHHPDWSNSWNTVAIDLVSHDAGGLTDRDRRLAEAINAVVDG
ncbi:MAG TPA: 4a-hydroxytetrahydrobiopterin dehydratase [Aquihabitans sp.]|jgi:4a-hydroxytetrahydrobiopterin dehydratase|nr:4a-hydroxytetrahydrobiopterin dehydratase [Aquihabitans sp.]